MAIPALSRNYWARAGQPYAANTTIALVCQSHIFALKQLLIDAAVGGTTSGTRVVGSKFTVLGSSDGTTAALDAVDRWSAHTNVVQNNSGSAHSWIVLRCAALGYDCLIDANSSTTANYRLAFTPSTTPFSGGSTTAGPTSTEEFTVGTTAVGTSTNVALIGDTATGNSNFGNFCVSDNGEFIFTCTRAGTGIGTTFIAFCKPTGGEAGDTRNAVAVGISVGISGRGAPTTAHFNSVSFASQRTPNGSLISTGGWSTQIFGGSAYTGSGATSALTGNYLTYAIRNCTITPQVSDRGAIPDWYLVGTVAVNSSYPAVGATQTHIVVGDLIIPFPVVLPTV